MTTEYYFKEGCFIEEWLNNSDNEDVSIARVRVEANSATRKHKLLNTKERYVILSGSGIVTVGDKTWKVKVKDVVSIKPGQMQNIENQNSYDLIFLAICSPRFEEKNYKECD